jgi:hypothetical protein
MMEPLQVAARAGGWRIAFDILMVVLKALVLTILWTAVVEYMDDLVMAAIRRSWQTTGHDWHCPFPLSLAYSGPIIPLALLYQGRSFPSIARGRSRSVLRGAVAVTAGLLYLGTLSAEGYPSIATHIFEPGVQM